MGWPHPKMLRAVSGMVRALCRKPPDLSRIWGLQRTTSGLAATTGKLQSPEEVDAICPEYLAIAERLHELTTQGADAESGLREMATMVASLSDSDQGKAAVAAAVAEARRDLTP